MSLDIVPNAWRARLTNKFKSDEACRLALRGEVVPQALGDRTARICTIRGIRHHAGFGEELHGVLPEFTRAVNARRIMSNIIPILDEKKPQNNPYCIWHPQIASQETYRVLAVKYPFMVYQVARACAVAGYTELYLELDILPDTHIAEEARESGHMDIYNNIMAKPARFSILNDYSRTIDANPTEPANLNGDTQVARHLAHQHEWRRLNIYDDQGVGSDNYTVLNSVLPATYFDITEDRCVSETCSHTTEYPTPSSLPLSSSSAILATLLCEPLPRDLPTVDKDLLIVSAAYYGDIDRYVRLRRPELLSNELPAIVRGIYHSTPFAVWWSRQSYEARNPPGISFQIDRAIAARFIMNNIILPELLSQTDWMAVPYLIWYPTVAAPSTYLELATRLPDTRPQVLRACIVGDYQEVFDQILVDAVPDRAVQAEANLSGNKHYATAITRRLARLKLTSAPAPVPYWQILPLTSITRPNHAAPQVSKGVPLNSQMIRHNFEALYDGLECVSAALDLALCIPDEWKRGPDNDLQHFQLDYENWPSKKDTDRAWEQLAPDDEDDEDAHDENEIAHEDGEDQDN